MSPIIVESALWNHRANIESFAYATFDMIKISSSEIATVTISDRARVNENEVGMYGVSPLVFDATIDQFLKVSN